METTKQIAADYIDAYEDYILRNPRTAVRMVMWLAIYDEQTAEELRNYLEEVKVFAKPADEKARASQMRKVHRWRNLAEESTGLPPRGKKGATVEYHRALQEWKKLNGRPTRDQFVAGWVPQPLHAVAEATVRAGTEKPSSLKPVTTPNPPRSQKTEKNSGETPVSSPKKREPRVKVGSSPISTAELEDGGKQGNSTAQTPAPRSRLTAEQLLELSRQEVENQRRPLPEKKTEPKPPAFRGSPPPPSDASEEEREAWRATKKQELADYITHALTLGWKIPPDWNGYGSVAKVAEWVGTVD